MSTINKSTWQSKIRALGPGIMMASAAVGGSHLIASTQAGAKYGWQLAIIIILANLFKYPFFRFGYQYTLDHSQSLLDGYKSRGTHYIWLFFILNLFAAIINTAAVALLCASILKFIFPMPDILFSKTFFEMQAITFLCLIIIGSCWLILLTGRYALLDGISKIVMISLTAATVTAVIIAMNKGAVAPTGYIGPSPWNIASLGFIIALMGWMPAPIEISAITSMWVKAKKQASPLLKEDGIFDFNVGYIGTAILAVIFLALGVYIQYGSPYPVESVGSKYIAQLINMYTSTIGEWSKLLVAFIAFSCMFGTTITVIDGYSRTNLESVRIILKRAQFTTRGLNFWITLTSIAGLIVILFFNSSLGPMLKFAMISSFLSTPIFAWLNLSLSNKTGSHIHKSLLLLAWIGLIYLTIFALVFLFNLIL